MSRSLQLGVRARGTAPTEFRREPDAQLLWVHASSQPRLLALRSIAQRLMADRDDLEVIATYDPAQFLPSDDPTPEFAAILPLPINGNSSGRNAIIASRPDVGLWTGGNLNGTAIRNVADTGTHLLLLDAEAQGFRNRKRRWFSDPQQEALLRFDRALTSTRDQASLLRRAGLPGERIEISGPLRETPCPPDCPDEEVVDVSQELAGRPVWLAAFAHPDEFGYVVTAHRNALRHAHRLLLVIVLEGRHYLDDVTALLEGMTLRHAVWHLGDPIDDQTQVLVADDPEDLGLWYRISPQTFLGHSLISGQGGRDPLDAAALGSAVLHGPNIGAWAEAYQMLTKAGAGQLVPNGNALGMQVTRLIAPDIAATMALAGWDVATKGAELTERVVRLVQGHLDAESVDHAPA